MRNNIILPAIGCALCVAALGAGCGSSDSPVSLDKYQNQQSTAPAESGLAPSQAAPEQAVTQPEAQPQATATTPNQTTMEQTTSTPAPQAPEKLAFPGILPAAQINNKFVHLNTTKGEIVFELLGKEGPLAASNFAYLVGHKFYDGIIFHRVEPGFVVQAGDPQTKDPSVPQQYWGTGGPGYMFADDPVNIEYYKQGTVAMANTMQPGTNGSQFFIMKEDSQTLPKQFSVFGRVIKGMDIVNKIVVGDKIVTATIENSK